MEIWEQCLLGRVSHLEQRSKLGADHAGLCRLFYIIGFSFTLCEMRSHWWIFSKEVIFSKVWRIFTVGGMNRSGVMRNCRIQDIFLKMVPADSEILTDLGGLCCGLSPKACSMFWCFSWSLLPVLLFSFATFEVLALRRRNSLVFQAAYWLVPLPLVLNCKSLC